MKNEKIFLGCDEILFSVRMVRVHTYEDLRKVCAIFDYKEFWMKFTPARIIETSRLEYGEFLSLMKIKRDLDHCIVLNETENAINCTALSWEEKFLSGE